MNNNAEGIVPQWAKIDDARITRFGKVLRFTRLDELPQLLNVILGDMSIVGPRPERPEFCVKLNEAIPLYNNRHLSKPGITGWAQIRYRYASSESDSKEKLQFDLFYIQNLSIVIEYPEKHLLSYPMN